MEDGCALSSSKFEDYRLLLERRAKATVTCTWLCWCENHHVGTYQEEEIAELKVFPNPFASNINIAYAAQQTGDVRLHLVDSKGRLMKAIFEGEMKAGETRMFSVESKSICNGFVLHPIVRSKRNPLPQSSQIKLTAFLRAQALRGEKVFSPRARTLTANLSVSESAKRESQNQRSPPTRGAMEDEARIESSTIPTRLHPFLPLSTFT